jgi:ribosomal protein L29
LPSRTEPMLKTEDLRAMSPDQLDDELIKLKK